MKGQTSSFVNFFTKPILSRHAISIESHHVAVASVAKKKGRVAVTSAAVEPLPPGVIEPRFTEINIKDKDRVTTSIEHALEKTGLMRERRWSLAIPRKATRGFIIQLDETPKSSKELAEVLQWKVERLLEVSMNDLTAAFQPLRPSDGHGRYLVVVTSNEVLASYEDVLAPLKIQPSFIIPAHLAEAAWLQIEPTHYDTLLIAAEAEEVTIIFLRRGDFLSIRSVDFDAETLSDEIHRTLVYYLDKIAPQGMPQLETILLIGSPLGVKEVEASCRTLFPSERLPAVHTLREEKLEDHPGLSLESIASVAGLAAMGL